MNNDHREIEMTQVSSDRRPTVAIIGRPMTIKEAASLREPWAILASVRASFEFVDGMVRPAASPLVVESLDDLRAALGRLEESVYGADQEAPTQRSPMVYAR